MVLLNVMKVHILYSILDERKLFRETPELSDEVRLD